MDGTDQELIGSVGRLRTKVCVADPPYASFDCSQELDGVRLDGPVAWAAGDRELVVARKHLIEPDGRKRTALFELSVDASGTFSIAEQGEFPSAGDTSYAGVAPIDDHRFLVTYYSGNLGPRPGRGRSACSSPATSGRQSSTRASSSDVAVVSAGEGRAGDNARLGRAHGGTDDRSRRR